MAWNVVIAGGGFGGLYAARRLERVLPRHSARITVLSDTNFLLYTPLLPGAAAGTLEPRHVVVPLREELDWADVQLGRVLGLDPALNELRWCTLDGREAAHRYDQLVLALGSVSRTLPIPGLAEHAVGFKTLADAIALRNRALLHLEIAESLDDPEKRREYLTFVFVGAGYAGVEGVAELQDMVADVIDRYPRCRIDGTRWILVEALDRIMPEIGPKLADFATAELRGRGIEIRTGTSLESVEADAATLSTGERIPTRTVCWTAGVAPPPLVRELGLPLDPGRPDRGRADAAGEGAREHLGDRRLGRRARSGRQRRSGRRRRQRSTRCARGASWPTTSPPRSAMASAAVPLQDPRRVRGHGSAQGGRVDAGRALPRLPGVVRGPDVPHADDAGPRAEAAPRRRLDGRALLRPRRPPSSASSAIRRRSIRPLDRGRPGGARR